MTDAEVAAAEVACKAYEGIDASIIPEAIQHYLAVTVIAAADAALDQSQAGRFIAADRALTAAITEAGHAGQVTPQQLADLTNLALAAVAKLRVVPPPTAG